MDTIERGGPAADVVNVSGSNNISFDGAWLLKADFVRQGPDLLVLGEGGQKTLLVDYFSSETPPDLQTNFGAVISADLASKLAGPVAPGQFAQAVGGVQLAQGATTPIGFIETVNGSAEAVRADGSKVILKQGTEIFSGDILETCLLYTSPSPRD